MPARSVRFTSEHVDVFRDLRPWCLALADSGNDVVVELLGKGPCHADILPSEDVTSQGQRRQLNWGKSQQRKSCAVDELSAARQQVELLHPTQDERSLGWTKPVGRVVTDMATNLSPASHGRQTTDFCGPANPRHEEILE